MGHMSVLNISHQAGGGADLASKAQILAYYELVLTDLKVKIANVIITIMQHTSYMSPTI